MQVPAECLVSARQGRAADLRVIFTFFFSRGQQVTYNGLILLFAHFSENLSK